MFECVQNTDFTIETSPFRHFVIDDFFTPKFYNQLCVEFNKAQRMGLSETHRPDCFSSFGEYYDAYKYIPNPRRKSELLNFFLSKEWKVFVENAFDIKNNPDISFALHHHKIGSADGWIHNDYSKGRFAEDPLPNGLNPWFYQCDYTDDSENDIIGTHVSMRATTVLFFFANETWKKEDGGEIGLFSTKSNNSLIKKIKPLNNRLLAFEISPYSFHAFQKNKEKERNSFIQWFHQDTEIMMQRFNNEPSTPWSMQHTT